jgi:hypothetical protein
MNLILDVPRFPFADLVLAVPDIDPNTMKGWLGHRGPATLNEYDRPAEGKGGRSLMTLRTIYEIAIAVHIVGLSIPPGVAFALSRHFTRGAENGRNPDSLLFDDDGHTTLIIVWRGAGGKIRQFDQFETYTNSIEIYNFDPKNSGDLLEILSKNNQAGAVSVIFVNYILAGVDKALKVQRPEKARARSRSKVA